MKLFYEEFKQVVNNPYIVFSAKFDGCVVNIYTTDKVTSNNKKPSTSTNNTNKNMDNDSK